MAEKKEHEDKGVDLVTYELGYHLVPSLGEDDLALRVKDLTATIQEVGGTISKEAYPESFVLAYTMRKLRSGKWENYDTTHFGWVRFEAPGEAVATIKDTLDHADFVVRYLVLKLDTDALTAPTPVVRRAPLEGGEVATEPKALVKRVDEEEKGEVSEEELDKQIEQLIS